MNCNQITTMAAIVRIKRRRDEDPQESLLLSSKKLRSIDGGTERNTEPTLFRFAGTVSSKEEAVSRPVKEAIRKEKLEREFKQHQINVYGEIRQNTRHELKQSSKKSRYKVVSNHRLLNLDSLEELDEVVKENSNNAKSEHQTHGTDKTNLESNSETNVKKVKILSDQNESTSASDTKTNESKSSGADSSACVKTDAGKPDKSASAIDGDSAMNAKDADKSTGAVGPCGGFNGSEKDKKLFCLLDVELELPTYQSVLRESSTNQITCNSQPMEKEVVSERGSDEDYVYDLYYVNNRDFDFGMLDNSVTFEAPSGNWLYNGPMSDDEFVYDDEDDSNDENNWRNDYPDEDDQFLHEDDEGGDYFGGGPYEIHSYDHGRDNDLADWMTRRCNIEDDNELSSDDEVEKYESGPAYSSGYYRYVKELHRQDSDSELDILGT